MVEESDNLSPYQELSDYLYLEDGERGHFFGGNVLNEIIGLDD